MSRTMYQPAHSEPPTPTPMLHLRAGRAASKCKEHLREASSEAAVALRRMSVMYDLFISWKPHFFKLL